MQWKGLADTLASSLCLYDLPCQHVDGYSKPEIEVCNSKELILPPTNLLGPRQEEVNIEQSSNSVRINLKVCLFQVEF